MPHDNDYLCRQRSLSDVDNHVLLCVYPRQVQVWARDVKLSSAGGTVPGVAVAAVNFADVERTVDIPLSMVKSEWGASTKVEADDVWTRTGRSHKGHITATIKPHDTALLQLTQP
eukprot:COSAG02_NODE_7751_length_2862_cov_3.193992_5_plen_115_part_00